MTDSDGYIVYAGEYSDLDTVEDDFMAIKKFDAAVKS
jgi:hypothetical protein